MAVDPDAGSPSASLPGPVGEVVAAVEQAEAAVDEAVQEAETARDEAVSARDEADQARDEADDARDEADQARVGARAAEQGAVTAERGAVNAGSEDAAFGRLGRPLRRDSPFMLGFLGALGVFAAIFLTSAVTQASSVLVLIAVALFLAIGLNPAVEWLIDRTMSRTAAVGIVFVLVILVFIGFGYAVVPPVVEQTNEFARQLPSYLNDLRSNTTIKKLDDQYDLISRAQAYVASGNLGLRLFGGIVGVGRVVVGAVFGALSILIMTLYFLAALPSMKRQAYRLVPATRRERVTLLTDEVLVRIGGFVSGALTVGFIAGLTSYVFLLVLGLPYALALTVLVAILDLVPLVGATIGAVLVTAIAFTQSPVAGVACIAFYIAYQQLENYVIYPRVMRRAVDVPAPVTVVAVLLGGALLGVVGALLAIPVAAAVLLVIRQVAIPRMDRI